MVLTIYLDVSSDNSNCDCPSPAYHAAILTGTALIMLLAGPIALMMLCIPDSGGCGDGKF